MNLERKSGDVKSRRIGERQWDWEIVGKKRIRIETLHKWECGW